MSEERFGGIEASDINDKDILEKTRQSKNKQGHVQWKYTCDDGHVIQSEWINPENLRRAVMVWCDVVRNTVAARAKELAASKQGKIILPEDIEESVEVEEYEDSPPPAPKPRNPVRTQPARPSRPVRDDDADEEVEIDEDVLLLKALKAKRKKLQAKLDKLDMIIETLED